MNTGQVPLHANDKENETEGVISALRVAVDACAQGGLHKGRGSHSMPHAFLGGFNGSGNVGDVFGNVDAMARGSGGLEALGSLVRDTALLEGAVEGVELGAGKAGKGILVKVSMTYQVSIFDNVVLAVRQCRVFQPQFLELVCDRCV